MNHLKYKLNLNPTHFRKQSNHSQSIAPPNKQRIVPSLNLEQLVRDHVQARSQNDHFARHNGQLASVTPGRVAVHANHIARAKRIEDHVPLLLVGIVRKVAQHLQLRAVLDDGKEDQLGGGVASENEQHKPKQSANLKKQSEQAKL